MKRKKHNPPSYGHDEAVIIPLILLLSADGQNRELIMALLYILS